LIVVELLRHRHWDCEPAVTLLVAIEPPQASEQLHDYNPRTSIT
jgi:hypothetical protein